ncbi:MAG: bifunctional diaminohydroxyphosphoribosylaminopyrimidine deaminase/5-amino-6-(5-phosphoribosylamino)uracil reductase RibD [Bacteroidales bacterium]
MTTKNDKKYMQACIDLAQKAFGDTYPNPMVGCVIVHNDTIIGKGYHRKAGEAHAEINALNSVTQKELLPESTLYVNLEPCSHYGKTPPCSDAIIHHNIKRVVIGCTDSNPAVSGKGIRKMQKAGIQVQAGILEEESRKLNCRFFTFMEKKRPYILLKWAQTQDKFIDQAPHLKKQTRGLWITDHTGKKLVHKWRTQEQAILVGTNTAQIDNPQLTARLAKGANPLRITIDLHNRLSRDLYIKDGSTATIIFTLNPQKSTKNLEYVPVSSIETMWHEIFSDLYTRNIQSIIIEGGYIILQELINKKLWDEARIFTGPGYFHEGTPAPIINGTFSHEFQIGNSLLSYFYQKN